MGLKYLKLLFALLSPSPVTGINIIVIENVDVNYNNLAIWNKTYESVWQTLALLGSQACQIASLRHSDTSRALNFAFREFE